MLRLARVDEKPEGWEWQKCTAPGCNRKATLVVEHKTAGRTHRCDKHTGFCKVLEGVEAKRGQGIARKRANAHGGWYGWERRLVGERCELCQSCAKPVAVNDGTPGGAPVWCLGCYNEALGGEYA